MQLQLKRSRATLLELRKATPEEVSDEGYKLRHRTCFTDGSRNEFSIEFRIEMTVEKTHHLTVQYSSQFETDPEFDEDFVNSSFVTVNAPAIAFPFIRSYVAHITLISGFESIILPSVNFKLKKEDICPREAE